MGDWCLIESDPGVFTELVDRIGVKGVKFEEVWDMDEMPPGVHGLVFLFKCTKSEPRQVMTMPPPGLFFAKQVIQNACATQAILSVLMNSEVKELGKTLTHFKEFSAAFAPEMKGLAISNDATIREVHNSFARQSSFDFVQDKDDKDDAFHFIGYVPHKGKVYELDGLQEGPIEIGTIGDAGWLSTVKPEIQQRMQKYQTEGSGEIRFNLLAITDDPAYPVEQEILKLRHQRQTANIKMVSFGEDIFLEDEVEDDDAPDGVMTFEELPDDIAELKKIVADATDQIKAAQAKIAEHLQRRETWRKENQRRRHDYVPFILCALKHLAKKGKLKPAYDAGKTEAAAEHERKKAEAEKEKAVKAS